VNKSKKLQGNRLRFSLERLREKKVRDARNFHLLDDPFRVRTVTLRDIFYTGIAGRQTSVPKFVTARIRETAGHLSRAQFFHDPFCKITAAVRGNNIKYDTRLIARVIIIQINRTQDTVVLRSRRK